MKQLYFDYHATTPIDPRVLDSMLPFFTENFGNAASKQHQFGWIADEAVEKARSQVASLIGAHSGEITFTSGGTEADNLALLGLWESYSDQPFHLITSSVEHKAVLECAKRISKKGGQVTILQPDSQGMIAPGEVKKAITPDTKMVSLIFGHNEIGAINPIQEIGQICRDHDVLFHTDAVQAIGRIPVNVDELHIDMASLSSHKIYGPKGVGALYIRKRSPRIRLEPLALGGGQERGLRSGTLNVPGIVGFGSACELALAELKTEPQRQARLRDLMVEAFCQRIPGIKINGPSQNRLCNNVSVTIEGLRANRLIGALKELAISTGSACSSASVEPSYVLKAIGLSEEQAVSTIRFGLGRFTTQNEVKSAINTFIAAVEKLRKL